MCKASTDNDVLGSGFTMPAVDNSSGVWNFGVEHYTILVYAFTLRALPVSFFSALGTSHKLEVIDLRGQSADSKNQLLVGHLVDRDSMECIQQRFREESSTFRLPCSLPSPAC